MLLKANSSLKSTKDLLITCLFKTFTSVLLVLNNVLVLFYKLLALLMNQRTNGPERLT